MIITLISVSCNFLMPMYLSYRLNKEVSSSSSIGIIGGADGPTTIYLASQSSTYLFTVVFALLSIVGILYLFFAKKAN